MHGRFHTLFPVSVIIILVSQLAIAQPQAIWIRDFDHNAQEGFYDIYAVSDSSYIMCGSTGQNWQYGSSWYIVKMDRDGQTIWEELYGDNWAGGTARSIVETDNGDFVCAGTNAFNGNVTALRINAEGELIWANQYLAGTARAVIELKGGDFLLCGESYPNAFVLMINGEGRELWRSTYSLGDQLGARGWFNSMRETDNQVVIAGEGTHGNNEMWHGWIVKIDIAEQGETIWETFINDILNCNTILSCDGGFVLSGSSVTMDGMYAYILKINDDGDEIFRQLYPDRIPQEVGTCLASRGQHGFAMVGLAMHGQNSWDPLIIRAFVDGSEQGRAYYALANEDGFTAGQNAFYSVVLGRDGSLVAAGAHNTAGASYNAIVIKWEADIAGPYFLSWTPEDTVLSVLPGDSVQFSVHSTHQWGEELWHSWWIDDGDTISNDTTLIVHFNEYGQTLVNCGVTDGRLSSEITWRVNTVPYYIRSYTPDSLDFTIRRGREIDFTIDVAAAENVTPEYHWTLTDQDGANELGGEDSVRIEFEFPDNYQVEALVVGEDHSDRITWDIRANSVIWSWWPVETELLIPVDTTVDFRIFPYDAESDSLAYYWLIDGERQDMDSSFDYINIDFDQIGAQIISGVLMDGAESDTINWYATVFDPNNYIGEATNAPANTSLGYPTPNPFNSSTRFDYYLSRSGNTRISVYDLSGRKVKTLLDGFTRKGRNSHIMNAANLPPGIYFIRLESGNESHIRKVVLVK